MQNSTPVTINQDINISGNLSKEEIERMLKDNNTDLMSKVSSQFSSIPR